MDFLEAHEMFLEYIGAKGLSDATILAYRKDARKFQMFLFEKEVKPEIEAVTPPLLRQFTVWLRRNGCSSSTIGRYLDSLSSFYKYLVADEFLISNPVSKVDRPRPNERIPVFLIRPEVDGLFYAVDNTPGYFQLRDRAILRTLTYCGLRRSELFALHWAHIDFEHCVIRVLGKGSKERLVPMNSEVQDCLWDYLQSRLPLNKPVVFVNRYKNPMYADTLCRLIRKHVRKAGIDKHVTPHTLRHTCATLLIAAGIDIVTVKEILGHEDINSTLIYTHTSPTRLMEAVNKLIH